MLKRNFWLLVHRYAGLLMACFLILVALTDSLLVFRSELEQLLNPRFFGTASQPKSRLL